MTTPVPRRPPTVTPERVLGRLRRDLSSGREYFNPETTRLVLRRVLFDGAAPPSWRAHAACDGLGDLFFPGRSDPAAVEVCRAVCEGCPVQAACLEDAMSWESSGRRFGVVGGLTPTERERLARQGRRAPVEGGAVA